MIDIVCYVALAVCCAWMFLDVELWHRRLLNDLEIEQETDVARVRRQLLGKRRRW